ncbi:MAG: hypothetical protein FD165_1902 [Gammaproteobacteria bacterium]|nr:MAG: hypothetical protein FD165_1902 [Gammaproteobacteria bacterium]TND04474.1 MAG: hypothetical protein FD120_1588 [Gammaproteobacteria bacterium]
MSRRSHTTVTEIFAALAPSGLGVVHGNLAGTILDVNPSYCAMLGYPRAELIGRSFTEITHPDDIRHNIDGLSELVIGNIPSYRVEKRYLCKDNTVIWASVLVIPIKGDTAAPDSLLCLVEDITAHKRLENDKQAIELRYQTLFSQLPDSVVLINSDYRVIGFNDEALRVYEYSAEEMLQLRVKDYSLAFNEAQIQEIMQRLMATGRQDFMSRHKTKSGRILDVKVSIRTITLPDGQIIFQCVFHDITALKQAERALMQEKANLNAILDNIPHLLWLKDTEGRYIAVNMPHVISAGRTDPQEILGKTDLDVWPRELAEKFRADDAEVMATRKRKQIEEYVVDKGRHIWVETNKTPILDKDGNVLGTVGFARDITASKQAAEALQQSEERLRQATRASRSGIFDHDHVTGTLYWSPELRDIYGRAPNDPATFDAFVAHVHPDDRERVMTSIRNAHDLATAEADGLFVVEFRLVRTDGTIRWVIARSQAVFEGQGAARRLVRTVGAIVDLTERKQMENALRESAGRLALATRAGGVGIWDWNVDSGKLIWGDSMFPLYGIRREEFSGDYEAWRCRVHPDDIAQAEADVQACLREPNPFDTEFRIVRPDGAIRHIKAHGEIVCDEHGRVQRLVGTHWDITELKRIEAAMRESHERLEQALDASNTGTWRVDLRTNIDTRDASLNRMLGLPAEPSTQPLEDWFSHMHPDDVPEIRRAWDLGLESGAYDTEHRLIRRDGTVFWVHDRGVIVRGRAGKPRYAIGAAMDITERKQAEENMRLAASIYESSMEAIMVTDERNRIVDINPAFTRITGYTLAEVAGQNPSLLQSGRHDDAFYREMWRGILNDGHWQGEIWDRRKNGEVYAKWVNISVIPHADGSVYRHIAQFSDITEKKRQDELIWTQANYDPLTNLPNRRLFQDRLEMEIRKSHRTGSPIALLLIDLDRFKEINDTLGHAKGDVLLIEAARRISACVRDADTVARLGGDEFTVILPEFGDTDDVERVAQEIIQELNKPFCLGSKDFGYISATVGITLCPDDAQDFDSLMKHVDQAMYRAKGEGRSRFGYFTPSMQQEAQEKRALTDDLRHALTKGELRVFYQPIIDMKHRKIVKAEALLRWQHPVRGMIEPEVFIPLAEESRMIADICEWVFQDACVNIDQWRKQFGDIIQVSINKSPVQFELPVVKQWSKILEDLGLPGDSITVEITEGLLLKESPKVKQRLLEFRNNGIEVSIDDFGTGFSSLSYLKQFNIDYLKIDRSFVHYLPGNDNDIALVEAIIVMARKLGIRTVAEGIETQAQHDLLASFGCDYAQGFLYSPAVPSREFVRLLES